MSETCANCRFHNGKRCHRYPPSAEVNLIAYGVGWSSWRFAKVDEDDFCGEYQAKDHPNE